MFLIRNAGPGDFRAMLKLARYLNSYNLPSDPPSIRRLLKDSQDSFLKRSVPDHRRRFCFVLENPRTGRIIGSSLIIARHGTPRLPHLSFKIGSTTRRSRTLSLVAKHHTLRLHKDSSGFTEIGGLILHPEYRGHRQKLGRQLSYVRFAFMARHPRLFRPNILVEYLPPLSAGRGNLLWQAIGRQFTGLDYAQADHLSATNKEFILSLFPREKLYVSLLPPRVIELIGSPSAGARASIHLLKKIGFTYLRQVDPFDGGPHYGAKFHRVSLIRKTVFLRYRSDHSVNDPGAPTGLVMSEKQDGIRAVSSGFTHRSGKIWIHREAARLLGLKHNERVSFTPLS